MRRVNMEILIATVCVLLVSASFAVLIYRMKIDNKRFEEENRSIILDVESRMRALEYDFERSFYP